jgi:hypothetical protein
VGGPSSVEAKVIISGVDMMTTENGLWDRAEQARKWFAINGPADAPPLPLCYEERERLKVGGFPHIIAWYARSLACQDFDVTKHPSFDDYARGVMASEFAPPFIKNNAAMRTRFPPRQLKGLGPGLQWQPPEQHAETMERYRRNVARHERFRAAADPSVSQEHTGGVA